MIWLQILLALAIAALLTGALTAGLGRRGPGPAAGFLFFFVLLFLFTWAGGLWLVPAAGTSWARWITFPVVGLFVLLILAALIPPIPKRDVPPSPEAQVAAEETSLVMGVFFWILLLGLLAAVISYYAVIY
jgi:hypothetical protein